MMRHGFSGMRGAGLVLLAASVLRADTPAWLKEAATSALPAYEAKVRAAVLVNQEVVTIEDATKKTRSVRYAVKVLNREGAGEASQGISYFTGAGKVRDTKAWLIMPSGRVKEYGKSDIVDANLVDGVYDEVRYQYVNARRDADPGSVFGFEATLDEKSVFSQFVFDFQDDLPALRSSFVLNLPAGWKAEGKLLGGGAVDLNASGNSYRWQLNGLKPFEREPNSPGRTSLNPRLVVSTFPPQGASGTGGHFQTWKEVSAWTTHLVDPSATLTAEVAVRARTLTGNAPGFWEKLKPLADDAQKIRYISIQMNVARGGGYTPHPAADVLRNSYGDCKDKANYLRTLLKAVGIDSYLVVIYSGDPRHTRPEWPSPKQFNHAILAIKVPDDTKLPAAFDYPDMGRMMLFDPTDDVVPLGFLPDHEQNSMALLVAGDKGDLFRVPSSPASANLLKRTVKIKLEANGGIASASIQDEGKGQSAFDLQSMRRNRAGREFSRLVEQRLGRAVAGASVTKLEPREDPSRETFGLTLEFTAQTYARMMQNRLMMVKPVVLPFAGLPDVVSAKRLNPLVVEATAFAEHVEVELPEGFSVDELPPSGTLDSAYGKYSARWRVEGRTLTFDRELELPSSVIPAAEYAAARDFFGKIGGTEQAPVVLVRK